MEETRKSKQIKINAYVLTAAFVFLAACLLLMSQNILAKADYQKVSDNYIENVIASLDERSESIRDLETNSNILNEMLVSNLSFNYNGKDFRNLGAYAAEKEIEKFRDYTSGTDITEMYITTEDGTILLSHDEMLIGENVTRSALFTEEAFLSLVEIAESDAYFQFSAEKVTGELQSGYVSVDPVRVEKDGDTIKYYSVTVTDSSFSQNDILIIGCSVKPDQRYREVLSDLSTYFTMLDNYSGISAFAADAVTGIIRLSSSDLSDYRGRRFAELGASEIALGENATETVIRIDGKKAIINSRLYRSEELGSLYICTLFRNQSLPVIASAVIIILIIGAITFLTLSIGLSSREEDKKLFRRKMAGVTVFLCILTTVFAYYILTMNELSMAMKQGTANERIFDESTVKNAGLCSDSNEYYENRKICIAESVRTYLESYESLIFSSSSDLTEAMTYQKTDESGRIPVKDPLGNPTVSTPESSLLYGLCVISSIDEISILDQNGRTIATSGDNWYYEINGPEPENAALNSVLECKERYYYSSQGSSTLTAVPINLYLSDENGTTVYRDRDDFETCEDGTVKKMYGLLLVKSTDLNSPFLNHNISSFSAIESIKAVDGSEFLVVRNEEDENTSILYSTIDTISGDEVKAFGFHTLDYKSNNFRFVSADGLRYLACITELSEIPGTPIRDGDVFLTLTKPEDIFISRDVLTFITFLITSLLLTVIGVLLYRYKFSKEPVAMISDVSVHLSEEMDSQAFKANKDPFTIIKTSFFLIALSLIVFYLRSLLRPEDGGVFNYVISRRWEKEFSIFSASYVLFLIVVITVIIYAAKQITKLIAPTFSPTTETVARLGLSILQYGGIMIIICYSMQLFGVQTGTVVTLSGILTGVIGLGANSLISDIIAGLFIIIESEFKVNDIVTIDNFTGVVKEIGLRTTKVLDSGGNLKTFNNSRINGVLNLTDNYSTAFITVNVSMETPVSTIEKLINTDLAAQMKDNKDIVEGPWFSGIMDARNGNYTISIGARCVQQNQWSVRKDLYSSVFDLFRKNGIHFS